MTAPDHFAKTDLNPFAGGGRPHMIYALRSWSAKPKVTIQRRDCLEIAARREWF